MQPQSPDSLALRAAPVIASAGVARAVSEAPDGADAHDENGPYELGQEMGSIGFPKVQQAEDVEYDHEQDAEQDRKQHDRGRKSFHIPNVTPSPADWGMPILMGPGVLVAIQQPTHYEGVTCDAPWVKGPARPWPDS
jgi:hypothetical protein